MAEWLYKAGHLLTDYQRFSHPPSKRSSKPSLPPRSQLSESLPGVVKACMDSAVDEVCRCLCTCRWSEPMPSSSSS